MWAPPRLCARAGKAEGREAKTSLSAKRRSPFGQVCCALAREVIKWTPDTTRKRRGIE